MWDQGLIDTSISLGIALNALPRSCALALSSAEWQQALTASLGQRNLHEMAPSLGSEGPLKMDRSIHKNTRISGCLFEIRERGEQQRRTEEKEDKRTRAEETKRKYNRWEILRKK